MSSSHRRADDSDSSELSDLSDGQGLRRIDALKPKNPAKRQRVEPDGGKGIYCHQCHGKCSPEDSVRCTQLKSFTKHKPPRACNLAWCRRDLLRKYDIDIADVKQNKTYDFECPACRGACQCAQCRKKRGLGPLAPYVSKQAKVQSLPNSVHGDTSRQGKKSKKKQDPLTLLENSDSDLSDLPEANGQTSAQSTKAKKTAKQATKSVEPLSKNSIKIKAKPRPKPKAAVPPIFEKVDTRLTRSQVEDRMALREYLYRFRAALSIPERNLTVLDDFDRPLTEGSVRLYAGAMLEAIKDDFEDEAMADDLFHYREELRYYADLARFAAIYKEIEEPLALREHSVNPPKTDNMLRSVLGLGEDEPIPWVLSASTKRGASRIPLPEEIVEMLLALVDRTLSTRIIRAELDSSLEVDARKQHAAVVRAVNLEWEGLRKKLTAEGIVCKNAAQAKSNRSKMDLGQREHDLELALANVNLRAAIAPLRHAPLGGLDGRTYHLLTPRPITDNARAPTGWASGLLVWGPPADDPSSLSRWSHFGRSASVRQLAKWLDSRVDAMRGKTIIEVVLPRFGDDSDSDLSSAPDDLLDQLEPIGYTLSIESQVEDGRELVRRINEVAEWLSVLEWKGLGEK